MPMDLSYLANLKNELTNEDEKRLSDAIQRECLRAIQMYLAQLADQMDENKIETLNVPTIRAMADEMQQRVDRYEDG